MMTSLPSFAPKKILAPGTDILFQSGICPKRGSNLLWRVWSGGKALDSFVVHTPTTVEIEERRHRPGSPTAPRTFDALGREQLPQDKIRRFEALFGP